MIPADWKSSALGRDERVLADVFVGAPSRLELMPLVQARQDLPASLCADAGAWADSEAWLPETPWWAAWSLLQLHWLGPWPVSMLAPPDAAHPVTGETRPERLNQDTLVVDWVSALDGARRMSGNHPRQDGTLANASVLWFASIANPYSSPDSSPVELRLGLVAAPPGQLVIEASAALMDAQQAHAVLKALMHTVSAMVRQPHAALISIQTLDATELQRQRVEWNPALSAFDAARTVPGRFSEQVQRNRDASAMAGPGLQTTFGQLDLESTWVAAHLQQQGVLPGQTVCVALGRSMASLVALLGILKAGAAYMPIDVSYPSERIAFMLADSASVCVVASKAHRAIFETWLPVLQIEDLALEPAAPLDETRVHVDGESLAYVMYTSGSTGTPKGIEICHRAILRLVVGAQFADLGTRVLHAAPLGFDASTMEVWGPLLNGGCCVVHDEEHLTGQGLARTIQRESVQVAWLTASLFNAIVDEDPTCLRGLRQLLIGGEALSVAHVRRAQRQLPGLGLINGYGPTECTTFTTTYPIPPDLPADLRSIPIGRPINDTQLHVLSPAMQPMPIGLVGELYVGGRGLARGYLNRAELSAERFVANPFGSPGERLYRTGDNVRYLSDGNLEFVGRLDGQIKVRGYRIEVGEIEAALATHPEVQASAVVATKDAGGSNRLVAYLTAAHGGGQGSVSTAQLRAHLGRLLPDFMIPAAYVWMGALPVTANGKLDRLALPAPSSLRPDLAHPYEAARGEAERRICLSFAQVLGLESVGRSDNFFDLGGNSLLVLRVLAELEREGGSRLTTNAFFRDPTPAALALVWSVPNSHDAVDPARMSRHANGARPSGAEPIAIIAMAGRFPGAKDVEQFWNNLCQGRDSITFFKDTELDPGLPAAVTGDANYVKARGVIADVEMFDAAFFGISPREAELMDPQQRVFMELCWECLERGGHAPDRTQVPVGVFAGMYNATYFQRHVAHRPDLIERLGEFQVMLANEKDYIATRTANRLNLTGPAVSIHTACSTSLVAIAQAFTSLQAGQCDMALAGGASITCPPRSGYLFDEGAMLSPDGQTRSFDANAQGTVFSDGAAVVLLKRLSDALADGNTVHAIVRGVAVNNDGGHKASFTAPSIDGQAAVICAAHDCAGIAARSIDYVEAHGTATPLGDPVELEGLTRAFRRANSDRAYCRIGSLKSNVGHMVIAAGAAGVIKTALSLAQEQLPPSIHFEKANPKLGLEDSPFVVNDRLVAWPRGNRVRRAGVSSFGVGGTNAHVVLEEAPLVPPSSAPQGPQWIQLSARSPAALSQMTQQLANWLEHRPELNLADVAYTLQVGRSGFPHRLSLVAESTAQAAQLLGQSESAMRCQDAVRAAIPRLVWLFPGQGSQYAGMGQGLFASDPAFRQAFDEGLQALQQWLPFNLLDRMTDPSTDALRATESTQPATFCLQYALARSWLSRGATPAALIGHSVGEFAAAVVAGVMSLGDAARLVARRGALMQALPAGAMLSVRLPATELLTRLPSGLSLAAENGPLSCVVSGPAGLVETWQVQLAAEGVPMRALQTSHAFHSAMMDPILQAFEAEVSKVVLAAPRVPIVSTLTGTWLSQRDALDPSYWSRHLRHAVRFAPALQTVLEGEEACFLEVGPRQTLTLLARQQAAAGRATPRAIASLGDDPGTETARMLLAQGQLWAMGLELTASAASPAGERRRVLLPTYAFERQRFWVEAARTGGDVAAARVPPTIGASPGEPLMDNSVPQPILNSRSASRMSPALPSTTATAQEPTRRTRILAGLRTLFEDVAGIDFAASDPATLFVELGLDSLMLTQATSQIKRRFKVAVTFRQLMEKYRSLDALGEHLDASMPPDPVTPVSTGASVIASGLAQEMGGTGVLAAQRQTLGSTAGAEGPSGGLLRQVIEQQMQIMAQQLALLAGASVSAPAVPAQTPAIAGLGAPVAAAADSGAERVGAVAYDVKKAFGAIARIHTQASAVTSRQRARLDAFVRRYVDRTRKSREFTLQHRSRLADPRVVNGFRPMTKEITYQIVVERSKGARLWDIDGNEYVDVLNGFGMNLFGWQPDFVQDAVRRQLDAGYEIGPQHPLAGEVAELICELTGFDRAGLCNTGSEAVMAAVRIARTVTGRNTVVLFTGAYHGTFDEVLVRSGRGGKGIPAAPGIMPGVFGDVRVLEYGTPETLEFIRAHADDLAAVLVEPVQSRRPDFQPREFLRAVRDITERSGTCLIFDEVITGFRAHLGGTQALFGLRADLACYGKVIGGGFPIGVVAGRRDFMDALDGGAWNYGDDSIPTVGVTYFAGTFVRHPLALAAAKASLEHLKHQGPALQESLNARTAAMAEQLNGYCREVGAPIEIRFFSSLWRVSWLEDHPLQDLLFAMMRSRGIHILDNFPCFMTTAHGDTEVAQVVNALKESVAELQESDFLPRNASPATRPFDQSKPPVPGARLGRDHDGRPAWFVPNADQPGKFLKLG